jgi:hypothetical protein
MAVIVKDVLDLSANYLNDAGLSQYTYVAQLPFFNEAQDKLSQLMESNNVPATNKRTTTLTVAPLVTVIDFTTSPPLPSDLIEIQQISERTNGTVVNYIPMTRKEFLPPFVEQIDSLIWWSWLNQQLVFIGATLPVQLMFDYIATVLPAATSTTSPITLINAKSYLACKTAALCAEFLGENKTRADELNEDAEIAGNIFLNINTKGRQAIATRRRPFMAAYKGRTGPW